MASKNKIEEAVKIYGRDVVAEVLDLVHISDPDGCYVLFEDQGMTEHMECVEFIYFE